MKVLQTLLSRQWKPGSHQDRFARLMRLPDDNHAVVTATGRSIERLLLDEASWRVCHESLKASSDQRRVWLNEPFLAPYEQFWLESGDVALLVDLHAQEASMIMRHAGPEHGPVVFVSHTMRLRRIGQLVQFEDARFTHWWPDSDCENTAMLTRMFVEACILIGAEHVVSIRKVVPGPKTGRQKFRKSKYSQPVFSHNLVELRFPLEMTVVDGEARWSDARGGNVRAHHVRAYTAKRWCKDENGNRYVRYVLVESHKRGNEALGFVVKTTKLVAEVAQN